MIRKYPRSSSIRKALGVGIVAESLLFGVAYYFYIRMNRSQEYRHWMREVYPPALEGYYRVGEVFGNKAIRQYDDETWARKA